jgi:hypothetical protein
MNLFSLLIDEKLDEHKSIVKNKSKFCSFPKITSKLRTPRNNNQQSSAELMLEQHGSS